MAKLKLNIKGMTCASCANNIKIALERKKEIHSASVDFALKTAEINFDQDKIARKEIIAIIEKTGYEVISDQKGNESEISENTNEEKQGLKTVLALALSLPLLLSMIFMYEIPGSFLGVSSTNWLYHNLAFVVVFILGRQFHYKAWIALKNRQSNMDTLVSLGTLSAYFYSTYSMFKGGHIYFEGAAVITALILLGRFMEQKTKNRALSALKKLMELGVKKAVVIDANGNQKEKDIGQVKIGETLLVRPGEKIPLDGIIVEGSSEIDESMLTGESIPLYKEKGSKCFAATLNLDGVLKVRVLKNEENTAYARIIKSVAEAQKFKAPIQKLADRISAIFVPTVITIATLTFIFTWALGGDVGSAILRAVSVLIISCPCALGIATPIAILVGSSVGARNGILIKNGESFEKAQKITTAIFDKTGTLTLGRPKLEKIILQNKNTASERILLGVAKSLAKNSNHPLSLAINEYGQKTETENINNFKELSGRGLSGFDAKNNASLLLGNYRLLKENNIDREWADFLLEKYKTSEYTILFVAIEKEIYGAFLLADKLKASSKKAISSIKNLGIRPYILSGDNRNSVKAVAEKLGIKDYLSEVLPEEKQAKVKEIQNQGEKTLFAGDGINDAPALAQADLGIAMASGADIAKEAGDIVITGSDPEKIAEAVHLSKKTFKTIKQNLFWAFFYNSLAIPLAVFGLVNPMVAALAMGLSDLTVIGNALRIYRYK